MSERSPVTQENIAEWIRHNGIAEVECIVPDMNGIIRGKVVPAPKFLRMVDDRSLRIPSSIFSVTVTGDYPEDAAVSLTDADVVLVPDPTTIRIAPGYTTPTAYVITDAYHSSGEPLAIAPRHILKQVIAAFDARGWVPRGGARTGVFSDCEEHRSRFSPADAGGPIGPRRNDERALWAGGGERVRGSDRGAVRFCREGAASRSTH